MLLGLGCGWSAQNHLKEVQDDLGCPVQYYHSIGEKYQLEVSAKVRLLPVRRACCRAGSTRWADSCRPPSPAVRTGLG